MAKLLDLDIRLFDDPPATPEAPATPEPPATPEAPATPEPSATEEPAAAPTAEATPEATAEATAETTAEPGSETGTQSGEKKGDSTEYFNYQGVQNVFNELDAEFQAFAKTLEELNMTIQENINVGADSGILGAYGSSILSLWNNNASTFGDFYKNFDNWSAAVISLAAANGGFEGLTASMFENHQSNGGTLDGVLDKRVLAAIMQGAERLPEKDFYEDGTVTIGDYTYKRVVDEHGNTIIKIYDKDNNLVGMQVITADGQMGSTEGDNPTIIKNSDGTYSYKVPNGNGTVEYVYDKNTHENSFDHHVTYLINYLQEKK